MNILSVHASYCNQRPKTSSIKSTHTSTSNPHAEQDTFEGVGVVGGLWFSGMNSGMLTNGSSVKRRKTGANDEVLRKNTGGLPRGARTSTVSLPWEEMVSSQRYTHVSLGL